MTATIDIERVGEATPEARALIEALDRELSVHYPPQQRHGLSFDAIFQPHVRFLLARRGGEAVGCGGVALGADCAEVKRMYVRPEARGSGVAEAILSRLIAEAEGAGLRILRLETGIHQAAAIRFYRRSGFQPCSAFEPYLSLPPEAIATSVFMERRIGRH